jgi:hypothetical protein
MAHFAEIDENGVVLACLLCLTRKNTVGKISWLMI